MTTPESNDVNSQLIKITEGLKVLKEQRTTALVADMTAIRESIAAGTGTNYIDLEEPIDFNNIIQVSSGGSAVMGFLGGGYREGSTVVLITSSVDDGDIGNEVLTISTAPDKDTASHTLTVKAGNVVMLGAGHAITTSPEVRGYVDEINGCEAQDPVSVFHRIKLAEDAVRFARQALLREFTAIDEGARANTIQQ